MPEIDGHLAVSTAEGRNRILRIGILTSVLNRGLAALTPLLIVPVGLTYLGASAYGAWAAAISLTAFMAFADLGVGTGLMTKLGGLDVESEELTARRYVTSAYAMMAVITLFALTVVWASAPLVDWGRLLGAEPGSQAETVEPIVLVTLSAVIVNMFASLIVRVQYGVGQQGRSNIWQSVGSLSALAMTLLAAHLDLGATVFVLVAAYTPVLVALVNSSTFFLVPQGGRRIRPRRDAFDLGTSLQLLGLGSKFLVVSVLMTASIALDPWIVARTVSLDEVPDYAIPFRVMALLGTVTVMLTLPLWPLHAKAVRSGDVAWIKSITFRMTVATTAGMTILGLGAALLGPTFVSRWLGGEIAPSSLLWFGLALWWVVQSATGPAFMVQNGAEILGPQTIGYLGLLAVIPLKWWVSARFGFAWIPFVGSAAYVLIIWPACGIGLRRALIRATRQPSSSEAL